MSSPVIESPSDSSLMMATSPSQSDIVSNNNNKSGTIDSQVSPTPSRQSRGKLSATATLSTSDPVVLVKDITITSM